MIIGKHDVYNIIKHTMIRNTREYNIIIHNKIPITTSSNKKQQQRSATTREISDTTTFRTR